MRFPVAVEWWLRPVISAARVGEHSAVVWNWLYLRPLAASRSNVGVGIGPPNVLDAPKPTSSVRIKRTLGAPAGACTSFGKSFVDACAVRAIFPLSVWSECGNTSFGFLPASAVATRAAGPRLMASNPRRAAAFMYSVRYE